MELRWWQRTWFGYVAAIVLVGGPALVAWATGGTLGRGFDALLLALLVGVAARVWGTGPGLAAAGLSFFALGVLSRPFLFDLHPDTAGEWVETVVFVFATVFLALQVGRLRGREVTATVGQREAATLSRLTALLVPDARLEDVGGEVVDSLADLTGAACVSLLLPDDLGTLTSVQQSVREGVALDLAAGRIMCHVWEHGVAVGLPRADREQEAAGWPASVTSQEILRTSRPRRDVALPLEGSQGRVEGVLYGCPRRDGLAFDRAMVARLVLVSRLLAVFLERSRLREETARAQATTEAEKLRVSMVSSVSHELKTPLASINATVTGLLDEPEPQADRVRMELASVAEDIGRLNRSISDLLDLSRLETEEWMPVKDWHDLADVVGSVVADMPERDRARIVLDLPEEPALAKIDFVQVSRAVHHLVENALAYSPANQRVVVAVEETGEGAARVTVTDRGPGVPESERRRIFEKFYRGSASVAVPHGTGLGLSIASEVVARHGGGLRVESARPSGARFVLELPGAAEDAASTATEHGETT